MLTPDQRRWRADKIGDLATYTVGALLIGQFLTRNFRVDLTLIGLAVSFLCFFYGDHQMKKIH